MPRMRAEFLAVPALALALAATAPTRAAVEEPPVEPRTAEQAAESPSEPAAPAGKDGSPIKVRWKNDLVFSTEDGKFEIKIRGNIHFDTKFYGGDSANPDQFDIRRARADFQGRLYEYLTFRVQAEFADSAHIRNAWVDFRFADWLHLRGGQMKPPFSTSWWTLDNNVHFLERGAGTPVYPAFDRGWWLWGDLCDKTLTWNVAGFTGVGAELDEAKGDIDEHKDLFARLFATPFGNSERTAWRGLHVALQASRGRQSVPTTRFETKGYSAAVRDDRFWTWETERTGSGRIDDRNRWGAELHYVNGSFAFSSEYLVAEYEGIRVIADDGTPVLVEDGDIESWSTWVSWFLTGETKTVSNFGWKMPSPKADFDPHRRNGPGAWEVLLRYTKTDTAENLFRTAVYGDETYRILEGAASVDEYTAGVSWTWNAMLRWQLNYVHLDGDGLLTGDSRFPEGTRRVDKEDMVGLRLIFKF